MLHTALLILAFTLLALVVLLLHINQQHRRTLEILRAGNCQLEQLVLLRTAEVQWYQEQQQRYLFLNSHMVRGSLARVMGLTMVLRNNWGIGDPERLLVHLDFSLQELDHIVKEINTHLAQERG